MTAHIKVNGVSWCNVNIGLDRRRAFPHLGCVTCSQRDLATAQAEVEKLWLMGFPNAVAVEGRCDQQGMEYDE
jgi:hypothetical protein